MRNLILTFIASLLISAASCAAFFAFHYEPALSRSILASVGLALVWVILLAYALTKFGKRGLWLLVSAPPILFVLFVYVGILWGCALGRGCV